MSKMLQDQKGNTSSKRVNSTILIWIGMLMGLTTWAVSLYHPLGDAAVAVKLVAIFIGMGGGLNATCIFERILGKKA